jgi:hypothetical protein
MPPLTVLTGGLGVRSGVFAEDVNHPAIVRCHLLTIATHAADLIATCSTPATDSIAQDVARMAMAGGGEN